MLRWLGVAGWEIRAGKTVILVDPFLSRKTESRDREWKTDEAAVLEHVNAANYIFAGHSHADHIGDIPFIAKRFGSKVIGSQTTTNIVLAAGVDKERLTTIAGGEKLDFSDFSVEVVESRHGASERKGRTGMEAAREISAPLAAPILGRHFVDGGCYLYYFHFGNRRVLHQSTANFIEEKVAGLRPDVALLASGHEGYDLKSVLRAMKPKVVLIHHYDEWRVPFSQGRPRSNVTRAQRFQRSIQAIDGGIKVIVPDFFMTYTLE